MDRTARCQSGSARFLVAHDGIELGVCFACETNHVNRA